MLRDFTLNGFNNLLVILQKKNYRFVSFTDFLSDQSNLNNPQSSIIILRHDIDLKKRSSLNFARLEHELGIKGTYYFRAVRKIFDPEIIKTIADLGHEIGYHYEDLSACSGDFEKAIKSFERNLNKFRSVVPVQTISMHGNSLSKFDNKQLWDKYNYRDYGLIGEPYFDLDFKQVLYLTDSAQRWNGSKIAVRDKVQSGFDFDFTTTFDIIDNIDRLPPKIMITVHPDRWTDNPLEWHRINAVVKIKNFIKVNFLSKRAEVITR